MKTSQLYSKKKHIGYDISDISPIVVLKLDRYIKTKVV